MKRLLGTFSRRRKAHAPTSRPALTRLSLSTSPAVTYAVGDVHGHDVLYRALEARLVADAARIEGQALIVLLGDVIDRGPRSADLVEHLVAPPPSGVSRVVLMGNHEDMFRRFIADPDTARDWVAWGGAETLASYGIHGDPARGYDLSARDLKARIATSVPPSHVAFYESLPLSLTLPDTVFAHAGGSAERTWDDQGKDDLIWSDPRRLPDGVFGRRVVHGHVPVGRVEISDARIAVDTGAYESGVLSAVRLMPNAPVAVFSQNADGPVEGPDL